MHTLRTPVIRHQWSCNLGSNRGATAPARSRIHSRIVCEAGKPYTTQQWMLEEALFAEKLKQQSRATERTISKFTFDRWTSHRSTARYIRHMRSLFNSSIIRGLAQPLLSVAGIALVTCMYEDLLADGTLPSYLPSFYLPTAPFDLTSFALALLLVFRTNTSYDRWLEVCTVWSGIGNRCRDTMRQLISHLSDSNGMISPLAAAMCRWVVAYARSLKAELEPETDLEQELKVVLTAAEMDELLKARHRPSFALSVLTELGAQADLRESHRIRLDENLTYFEDAVGVCERILRTPIPLAYTRHTSRFMVIWLSALPLGLYATCGWGTIPLSVVVAFLLLGIDEIGVQIEEPFGLLPLDDLCAEIEGDMFGMLQEATIAKNTAKTAKEAALGLIMEDGSMPLYTPLPSQRLKYYRPDALGDGTRTPIKRRGSIEWDEELFHSRGESSRSDGANKEASNGNGNGSNGAEKAEQSRIDADFF